MGLGEDEGLQTTSSRQTQLHGDNGHERLSQEDRSVTKQTCYKLLQNDLTNKREMNTATLAWNKPSRQHL